MFGSAEKTGGEMIKMEAEVKPKEIQELLEYFSKNTYKAKDTHPKVQAIMQKCLTLFALDYHYSVVSNNGDLSSNYPSHLVILEGEKKPASSSPSMSKSCDGANHTKSVHFVGNNGIGASSHVSQSTNGGGEASQSVKFCKTEDVVDECSGKSNKGPAREDSDLNSVFIETSDIDGFSSSSCPLESPSTEVNKLKDLMSRARFARCRARFPISVILFENKHICRSSTLSGGPEIYGRSSFDYLFSGGVDWKQYYDDGEDEIIVPESQDRDNWQLFDRVRNLDIKLLKQTFKVQTIVDLMVEKKKVKFGVNVTSSEKVDKENRYSDFTIVSLPYPGCEFFKTYKDNGYNAEELVFEWNQTHVDADVFVPRDSITKSLKTDWTAYRKWDLIALTQNYMKLLLAYLRDSDSDNGILIHCISGWDRTPLFISLIRLSLWADGAIHKSLSAEQILFLTLAYDWLCFGHNLPDRINKGEEILFFCFYFLKYIVDAEYNIKSNVSSEVPKSNEAVRTRNDSDVQLDGVLLDVEGGTLTSPEGSSWSLSSCSSTSSKSVENPPVYFNVEPESWDESLGTKHLKNDNKNILIPEIESSFAHGIDDKTECESANKNYSIDSSSQGALSSSLVVCDGYNGNNPSSLPRPNSNNSISSTSAPVVNFSNEITTQNGNSSIKLCQGKTSPVAVPRSNRTSHHRHESTSSASIGSWQFITGTGSLRETISSGSSHSHPSRLSLSSAMECIETSESSCTLVEELTPVEFPERHPLSSFDSNSGVLLPTNGTGNGDGGFENELGDSVVLKDEKAPTAALDKPSAPPSVSTGSCMSVRQERLTTLRALFYSLYATGIGFQFKNVNDNGSGGGLGSLIGNFATKVGIRSARHMS